MAIIVKHGICYEVVANQCLRSYHVKIHTFHGDFTLMAMYVPKQCVDRNLTAQLFTEVLRKLTDNRTGFVVAGDLNTRYTLRRDHVCNKNGAILADHLSTCCIHYPDEQTFLSPASTTSIVDVFL